jgi:hypothetical protein
MRHNNVKEGVREDGRAWQGGAGLVSFFHVDFRECLCARTFWSVGSLSSFLI